MADHKTKHVEPRDEGGWEVKGEGALRASRVFDNKQEAIDYARQLSINQKVEMIVHNKDGEIAWRNSYGSDPHPPKG